MSALPMPTLCDLYALQPHLPLHVFLLTCRECSLSDLFVCARMYAGWLTAVAFARARGCLGLVVLFFMLSFHESRKNSNKRE